MEPQNLRIAISGGGLAGAALAHALCRHPHLEINIYESAPKFSERGAAIGLAINARRALARIVGQREAEEMLERAGAVKMNSARIMIGSGPDAGTKVLDIAEKDLIFMVHRAALLQELLAPIPKSNMHTSKKLVRIDQQAAKVTLAFEDGATVTVDALIGADGIFGFVRSHILGANHSALKPVLTGWAGVMKIVPLEDARRAFGDGFDPRRQYGWVGENGIMIHDSIETSNGVMVQCIATSVDRKPTTERHRAIDREYLETAHAAWLDGPVARPIIDLILSQDNPTVNSQQEHLDAPTYVNGLVCLMGDAAHAMTPWLGSGGAMALEDTAVLSALLADIRKSCELEGAFAAYDAVRRPRCQRVAQSSRETGRVLTGIAHGVGLNPEKMREALEDRWAFIHECDLDEHIDDALRSLRAGEL